MAKKNEFKFILTLIILNFFLITNSYSLENDWIINSDSAVIDFTIKIPYDIYKTSNDFDIKSFTINLTGIPKNYIPKQNEKVIIPNKLLLIEQETSKIKNDLNSLNLNEKKEYEYTIYSKISNDINENTYVKNTPKFPYNISILNIQKEYLKETEFIDYNNKNIKDFLKKINLTDDAYINSILIAKWINTNIKYDLNTMTESAQQKASWTLINNQGACDEITNLFIASLRAINIPTKAVSGIAFTNLKNNYSPHAWSEIYIDNSWIPFDVTYGEFGFVDPGHIELDKSNAINKDFINYIWLGRNVELDPKSISYDILTNPVYSKIITSLKTENQEKIKINNIEITAQYNEKNIGINSYNSIKLNLTNNNDYYQILECEIITPEGVNVLTHKKSLIVLKPKENLKNYIVLKYPSLDPGYKYTYPIKIIIKNKNTKYEFNEDMIISKEYENIDLLSIKKYLDEKNYRIINNDTRMISSEFSSEIKESLNYFCKSSYDKINKKSDLNCEIYNGAKKSSYFFCLNEINNELNKLSQSKCEYLNFDSGAMSLKNFKISENKIYLISFAESEIINLIDIEKNAKYCSIYQINKLEKSISNISNVEIDFDIKEYELNLNFETYKKDDKLNSINTKCEKIISNYEPIYKIKLKINNNEKIYDLKSDTYNIKISSSVLNNVENDIKITLIEDDSEIKFQNFKINYKNITFMQKIKLFFRKLFG